MLKKLKHGFTLVELVIVIAVIAVLAAVLIPTFISVIDSANNSADVQLAGNLTTALVDAQVYPDEVASAQNIRKHVKDFGYEPSDLVTKKSSNVIAYNKAKMKVEVLDVSKITADQLVSSYYAEEVISGYIIISTGGNDLAEALYALSNLPGEGTSGASLAVPASSPISPVAASVDDIGNYVANALNKISNSDIRGMVMNVVQATLYVNPDSNIYTIGVDENGEITAKEITSIPTYDLSNINSWELPIRSRVSFSEKLEEFDIAPLLQARTALTVVVPNTVTLTNTSGITDYADLPSFSGNVGSAVPSEKIVTVDTAKEIAGEAIVDDIAEAYEQAKSTLYNVNQVYTSDFKNNFDATLEIAKKVYDIKTQKAEGKAVEPIRLVVNGHSTIAGAVTIPDYIDVQIPFALGNANAKAIMEYDLGDALGGKPLGSAYPANDNGNLSEDNYYLCGEGPGGGTDYQIQQGLSQITSDAAALKIFTATNNISTTKADYSLTVALGATLNVEGKLTIGAVIGYPDASGYQGHTSGAYGYIINNGVINVKKGGALDVWGFIEGSGKVVTNEGGIIFEPFVVADYLDTVATLWAYPFVGLQGDVSTVDFNFPFMRYTVMNIKTDITMNYGSALYGRANLIVFGGFLYCRTSAPLITSDNYVYDTYENQYKTVTQLLQEGYTKNEDGSFTKGEGQDAQTIYANGAFVLSDGSSIMSTYSNNCIQITDSSNCEDYEKEDITNKNSFAGDIGVNNITIKGNVSTGSISLNLLGGAKNVQGVGALLGFLNPIPVTTANCIFPVPYHFNFTVEPNSTLTLNENNKYALLPGSGITIKSGANLIIKNNAALYALDTYDTSEMFRQDSNSLRDYFNTFWNTDEIGAPSYNEQTGIFDFGYYLVPMIKITLTRKYYPSAKLLTESGFSASANLAVNGTVTVENGGDLGGTVTAGDSATIKLAKGAGIGKVINLGGSYFENAAFYQGMHKQVSGSYDKVGSALKFINTVYVSCYLNVVNSKGNAISFEKETHYIESTQDKEYAKKATNTVSCTTDLITIETQDTELTIKLPYRTAKTDITIDSQMLNGSMGTPVKNTRVAYFSCDSNSTTLTLKDNTQPAE